MCTSIDSTSATFNSNLIGSIYNYNLAYINHLMLPFKTLLIIHMIFFKTKLKISLSNFNFQVNFFFITHELSTSFLVQCIATTSISKYHLFNVQTPTKYTHNSPSTFEITLETLFWQLAHLKSASNTTSWICISSPKPDNSRLHNMLLLCAF